MNELRGGRREPWMGETLFAVAFFPSERLTVLSGSRHSLSRCCVCFALPHFSSRDRAGAQTLLQHLG